MKNLLESDHLETIGRLKKQVRSKYSKKSKTYPLYLKVAAAIAFPLMVLWLINFWVKTPEATLSEMVTNNDMVPAEEIATFQKANIKEKPTASPKGGPVIVQNQSKRKKGDIRVKEGTLKEDLIAKTIENPESHDSEEDITLSGLSRKSVLEDESEISESQIEIKSLLDEISEETEEGEVKVKADSEKPKLEDADMSKISNKRSSSFQEAKSKKEGYFDQTKVRTESLKNKKAAYQDETSDLDDALSLNKFTYYDSTYLNSRGLELKATKIGASFRKKVEKYTKKHLKYPKEALVNEIEGVVLLKFNAYKNGYLSDFEILDSLGFGCDQEAIRLLENGPKWPVNKGFQKNTYIFPISFQLPSK